MIDAIPTLARRACVAAGLAAAVLLWAAAAPAREGHPDFTVTTALSCKDYLVSRRDRNDRYDLFVAYAAGWLSAINWILTDMSIMDQSRRLEDVLKSAEKHCAAHSIDRFLRALMEASRLSAPEPAAPRRR